MCLNSLHQQTREDGMIVVLPVLFTMRSGNGFVVVLQFDNAWEREGRFYED